MVRNVVPIIKCSPWNHVATKNVDPYAASAIVNGTSKYSYASSAVKYRPNLMFIGPCIIAIVDE